MSVEKVDRPLKAVKRLRGGVNPPHKKNTAERETVRMPCPDKTVLAMNQHLGVPCEPVVKIGDSVAVGQIVGDSQAYLSAPIHATISGRVSSITELEFPNGTTSKAVVIESDGEMREYGGIRRPDIRNKEDFLLAIRQSGLVGLGGAGFPAHVKMNPPEGKEIDTLIVNAAECEPFITVDYRECVEHPEDVLDGIRVIKETLEIPKVIIAVEDNKPEAIDILTKIAATDKEVFVMKLKSKYPQGAEKALIYASTGRRVPMGGLPMDVGCLVMNVSSVSFVARYVRAGRPLTSRTLTIDGTAILSPKNIRAPLGTYISDIIEFAGGYKRPPKKLLMGGPMMGIALSDDKFPILKNNNAILAFDKDVTKPQKYRACIRCGRCAYVCPMGLIPAAIEAYERTKDIDQLNKLEVTGCMECGSCAFICPSGRPLAQTMRAAKAAVKNAK